MPRELAFTSPPALAVAAGATTPVGRLGAEIWSTTALRRLVWTGTQWADALAPIPTATGVQGLFFKLNPNSVAFTKTGASTVSILAVTSMTVPARMLTVLAPVFVNAALFGLSLKNSP